MTRFAAVLIAVGLAANAASIAYLANVYEKESHSSRIAEICKGATANDFAGYQCLTLRQIEVAEYYEFIDADGRLETQLQSSSSDATDALPTVDFEYEEVPAQ